MSMIATPAHPALTCLIKSRLSGAAIDAIANEGSLTNWQAIKGALQRRLGEPRNEIQLMQELMQMRKLKSEDAETFGRRLRELLDTLNAVGMHTDKSYYENMAIEQYVNQLEFQISMGVRIAKPITLELAIVSARQEEARLNSNRFAQPSTSQSKPKPDGIRPNLVPFKPQFNSTQPRPFNPGFVPQSNNWPAQRTQWPQQSTQPWKGKSSGNFRGSQMVRPQQNIPQQTTQQVNPPQRHSDVTMRTVGKPQKPDFAFEELFYTQNQQGEYEQSYDYPYDSQQAEMQDSDQNEDFCVDQNPDDHS